MAGYNYDTVRVTMAGTSFSAAEEWSTGFWLGGISSPAPEPTQVAVDAIAGLWTTFFQAANSHVHNVFKTVNVKMSFYPSGEDNVDADLTKFHNYITQPVGGQTGSPTLPPQISVVASLHSTPSLGLAGKGRMFLPGCHLGLNTDAQISPTERGQLATTLATFLTGVNAISPDVGTVANASKGRIGIPFANAITRPVTTVRIGSIYDTQRRRRNQLNEVYSSAVVV